MLTTVLIVVLYAALVIHIILMGVALWRVWRGENIVDRLIGADLITTITLAILVILWVQLTIGLVTLPYSFGHKDATVMLVLADWAQRIVTFRPEATGLLAIDWPYKVHLVLGMTIFLLFPFSRLVHVWSGFATIGFLFRPHQVVRSRRLNVPAGHNQPRQPGAGV